MVNLLPFLTLVVWLVSAQNTFDPSMCVSGSGITTFPNCNYFLETSGQCDNYSVLSQLLACYCNQPLLNAIYGCESEARICFGNEDEDKVIQNNLATWHTLCDTYITFAPTTPIVSTASYGTVDYEACTVGESACARQSVLVTSCSLSAKGSSFFPCVCQSSILLLQYTCIFYGSSCVGSSADITDLSSVASFCPNLYSVLGTTPVGVSATTTAMTRSSTSIALTSPSAGSTPLSVPSSTQAGSIKQSTLPTSAFSFTVPSLSPSATTSPTLTSLTKTSGDSSIIPSLKIGRIVSLLHVLFTILQL